MQNVTIETLLSIKPDGIFSCSNSISREKKNVVSIADSLIPDHIITCDIPQNLRRPGMEKQVQVQIHILWLNSDSASRYTAFVADKQDCKIYFADVQPDTGDSDGLCRFVPLNDTELANHAKSHNVYLENLIHLSKTDKQKLLEYQIYSPFTDRYWYVEIPCSDRVIMYGVGINDNRFLYVGWLGKLINKDFYVAYAECTPMAYQKIKAECPSLYDRAQQMERFRPLLTYYQVIHEKRKKHAALAKIVTTATEQPLSRHQVIAFCASPKGRIMKEYRGQGYSWMIEFFNAYKRQFYSK